MTQSPASAGGPGRSLLSRLAGNTAIGFAGNAVQRGLTFAITLILARGLGGESFGLYSYVVSYMFLFAFLSDLGVERVVTREVSRDPAHAGELIGSGLLIKLGLSLASMTAAIGLAFAIGMPRAALLCVVIAAIGLPMNLELVFRGYFQSRFQVGYSYATTLPATVWFLVAALVVTRFGLPLHFLFAIALVSAPFIVVALLWVSRYRFQLVLRARWTRMRRMLRDSAELGGFIFLFVLSMRLDQILLFHLRGEEDVALYAVGVRLSEALSILPEAVMVTVFPLLVSSEHTAPDRFHHTNRLGFKYLAGVGILIAFAMTILRDGVVGVLYGPSYAAAAVPMAVLCWNMSVGYVGVIYLSLFLAQSRQRSLLLVSALALAVNILLNLAWIPPYGATGAAVATLVANLAGFAVWLVLPTTRLYMVTCVRESWRALLAAVVTAAALWSFSLSGVAAFAALLVLYPALLWSLGGITWGDVALVRRLFGEPAGGK